MLKIMINITFAIFLLSTFVYAQEHSYCLVASKPSIGERRPGCRIYKLDSDNKKLELLHEIKNTTASIKSIAVDGGSRIIALKGSIYPYINKFVAENKNGQLVYDDFVTTFLFDSNGRMVSTPLFVPAHSSTNREILVITGNRKVAIAVHSARHDKMDSFYFPTQEYRNSNKYAISCYNESNRPTMLYQGISLFSQNLGQNLSVQIDENTGIVFRFLSERGRQEMMPVDKDIFAFLSKRDKSHDITTLPGTGFSVGHYSKDYILYSRYYDKKSVLCLEYNSNDKEWRVYHIPLYFRPMKKYGNIQVYQNVDKNPSGWPLSNFGGKYLFHTIGTDTKEDFIWEVTPQTELLSINDGVVLYRVGNSLYTARIKDKEIVDDQLILEAADVENVHWAFQINKDQN